MSKKLEKIPFEWKHELETNAISISFDILIILVILVALSTSWMERLWGLSLVFSTYAEEPSIVYICCISALFSVPPFQLF